MRILLSSLHTGKVPNPLYMQLIVPIQFSAFLVFGKKKKLEHSFDLGPN